MVRFQASHLDMQIAMQMQLQAHNETETYDQMGRHVVDTGLVQCKNLCHIRLVQCKLTILNLVGKPRNEQQIVKILDYSDKFRDHDLEFIYRLCVIV